MESTCATAHSFLCLFPVPAAKQAEERARAHTHTHTCKHTHTLCRQPSRWRSCSSSSARPKQHAMPQRQRQPPLGRPRPQRWPGRWQQSNQPPRAAALVALIASAATVAAAAVDAVGAVVVTVSNGYHFWEMA
eukprot:1158007-Pelagomonas_calceolata.AAC.10